MRPRIRQSPHGSVAVQTPLPVDNGYVWRVVYGAPGDRHMYGLLLTDQEIAGWDPCDPRRGGDRA